MLLDCVHIFKAATMHNAHHVNCDQKRFKIWLLNKSFRPPLPSKINKKFARWPGLLFDYNVMRKNGPIKLMFRESWTGPDPLFF